MSAKRFQVFGRVQGVGFRYSAQRVALELRLSGWCRNLADGSVEVCACGDYAGLEQLHAWLRRGPPAATVTRVEAFAVDIECPDAFEIRH